MPGADDRSSREREVLPQARPRREARRRHPAARVVAVDQVDDLEDVRVVALAVHHQQVRQRERRVAQDVRPDLRQLGLHRRRLHDRAPRRRRTARRRARPTRAPTPPTMHGSVPISSRNFAAAMRSGTWATNTSVADREAAVLLQVAGDELRRPRRDRRAQHHQVPRRAAAAAGRPARDRTSPMSISMCENVGVPTVRTIDARLRGVGRALGERQSTRRRAPAARRRPAPRTASGPARSASSRVDVLVDAEHAQAGVGEAERQRQPDPAQPDDRDVVVHEPKEG